MPGIKQKYIDQKIYKGEGLAGQSWQEKDTIYVTDVPDDYIAITSGLGDANPTSILIVPLIVNDEVYGAIELASFNEFDEFEIEFLEKIAESIASSISSAKINSKTQKLLGRIYPNDRADAGTGRRDASEHGRTSGYPGRDEQKAKVKWKIR